jgi:hypothetical protein
MDQDKELSDTSSTVHGGAAAFRSTTTQEEEDVFHQVFAGSVGGHLATVQEMKNEIADPFYGNFASGGALPVKIPWSNEEDDAAECLAMSVDSPHVNSAVIVHAHLAHHHAQSSSRARMPIMHYLFLAFVFLSSVSGFFLARAQILTRYVSAFMMIALLALLWLHPAAANPVSSIPLRLLHAY